MKSIRFLSKFLINSKKPIILGIVFTLLMSIFELFPGVIYKVIADSLENLTSNTDHLSIKVPVKFLDMKFDPLKFSIKDPDRIFQAFVLICILFMIIYILDGLFRYLRDIYFNFAIQKILKEIKDTICEKIIKLPYTKILKSRTGDLMSRVTYDVTILQNVIDLFIELSRSSIALLIFCPVLFYIDFKISVFAALFFPVSLYIIRYFSRKMKKLSKGISDTTADYTELLKDNAERNQLIKMAGTEDTELGSFKDHTLRYYQLAVKNIKIKYFLKPSNEIMGIFGIAVIAVYFCYLLVNKQMGAGNIVLYLSVLKAAYKPFKKVAESLGDLNFSLAGADKIVALLENPDEENQGTDKIEKIDKIELKDVSLTLGGNDILNNISISLEKGGSLGITGASGTGKTSLVNLIPAFYHPDSGEILINNKKIREYDNKNLRSKIAFVNNENTELSGTIFKIITYGIKEPEKAVSEFGADRIREFIGIKDFDLNTTSGRSGIKLSSGQVQKLYLINSLLKDPDLFIIDEGLDLLGREDIDSFFEFTDKDKAVIIVSKNDYILSRLSIIYNLNK
ncbi:TPA: hypothetical protein DCR49_07160 [Candidatus Delongbacteria bacterium]|nr:hypothetical protein [Candidatus Delongbacteria bacterium]